MNDLKKQLGKALASSGGDGERDDATEADASWRWDIYEEFLDAHPEAAELDEERERLGRNSDDLPDEAGEFGLVPRFITALPHQVEHSIGAKMFSSQEALRFWRVSARLRESFRNWSGRPADAAASDFEWLPLMGGLMGERRRDSDL